MKIFISIILISISSLAIAQEENDEKLVSNKLKSLVERQKTLGTDTIITYQLKSNGSFGVVIPENANKKTIDSLSCDYKTATFVLSILNGNITINKLNPCLNFKPLKIISPSIISILKNGPNNLAFSKVKPFQFRDKKGKIFGQFISHSSHIKMTVEFSGIKKEMLFDRYSLNEGTKESKNINYLANMKSLQFKLSEAINKEIQKAKFQIAN